MTKTQLNMVKADELKIGNWLIMDNMTEQVYVKVNIDLLNDIYNNKMYHYNSGIEPIPLNNEILVKAGFEDVHENGKYYKYVDEYFLVIWEEKKSNTFRFSLSPIHSVPIRNLHQLQNLFYNLMGKELIVNL